MARFGSSKRGDIFQRLRWLAAVVASLSCQLLFIHESAQAQGEEPPSTIGQRGWSGVVVDADGVLRRVTVADPTGELAQQRVQEALTRLDRDVARRSPLRKVSLTRLERIIQQRL